MGPNHLHVATLTRYLCRGCSKAQGSIQRGPWVYCQRCSDDIDALYAMSERELRSDGRAFVVSVAAGIALAAFVFVLFVVLPLVVR